MFPLQWIINHDLWYLLSNCCLIIQRVYVYTPLPQSLDRFDLKKKDLIPATQKSSE